MQKYLTPGSVDDFLGIGMDVDDNSNSAVGGEEDGLFNIPRELLVKMPIADVTATTKIIHLGEPLRTTTQGHPSQSQEATPPFARPATPQPGTSGVPTGEPQPELMDVEGAATPGTTVAATIPTTAPQGAVRNRPQGTQKTRVQPQVKKGVQTKNRKTSPDAEPQGDERDELDGTFQNRMALLGKITNLLKDSYGSRRSEVEVWGQYIGLKASRIRVGRRRDRAFMNVEDVLNEAIYEDTLDN